MIRVFGRENCRFCEMAKAFLTLKGLEFEYITDTSIVTYAAEVYGMKTVPIIVHGEDEVLIGGYRELLVWYADKNPVTPR